MSNIAIKVENLGKLYRLGEVGTGTISHDLNRWWARMRGQEDPFTKIGETNDRTAKGTSDYVWSLKDINFEVRQGEVLGIIGRNGAGKSTLLKILSKITAPTTGKIKIKGRIASLLEVGTGFHPELSGRENIFLNGAILGMTKAEIHSKFDEIVDFAGVERYIDTPVKRYSSGMYVRLAFAVAAFLEPEILIVDEVLAVGDAEFQKKCIGRMKDVSVNDGRTVLFVSHNMHSIKELCQRGIILKNGTLNQIGDINNVIRKYEEQSNVSKVGVWTNRFEDIDTIKLDKIVLRNNKDNINTTFLNTEPVIVEFILKVLNDCSKIKIGFDLLRDYEVVFRSQQVDNGSKTDFKKGEEVSIRCIIPPNLLNIGVYNIRPIVSIHCVRSLISFFDPVLQFEITFNYLMSDFHGYLNEMNHPGSVFPALQWNIS